MRALLPEAFALHSQHCSHLRDVFDQMAQTFERAFGDGPSSTVSRLQ